MVFKRRDKRPFWKIIAETFWPRGGWTRAFLYTKHRLRRLPDSPEKISRGLGAGVFTAFTPFLGMHFVIAMLMATVVRGNIIAALIGTFVANPLTFVPIGALSLKLGYWILGMNTGMGPLATDPDVVHRSFGGKFIDAAEDLRHNFIALFTDDQTHWQGLEVFYHEIFFPYLIGGLIPGTLAALAAYFLTEPLIRAYQARRRGRLKAKLAAIRAKQGARAEARSPKPASTPAEAATPAAIAPANTPTPPNPGPRPGSGAKAPAERAPSDRAPSGKAPARHSTKRP